MVQHVELLCQQYVTLCQILLIKQLDGYPVENFAHIRQVEIYFWFILGLITIFLYLHERKDDFSKAVKGIVVEVFVEQLLHMDLLVLHCI